MQINQFCIVILCMFFNKWSKNKMKAELIYKKMLEGASSGGKKVTEALHNAVDLPTNIPGYMKARKGVAKAEQFAIEKRKVWQDPVNKLIPTAYTRANYKEYAAAMKAFDEGKITEKELQKRVLTGLVPVGVVGAGAGAAGVAAANNK